MPQKSFLLQKVFSEDLLPLSPLLRISTLESTEGSILMKMHRRDANWVPLRPTMIGHTQKRERICHSTTVHCIQLAIHLACHKPEETPPISPAQFFQNQSADFLSPQGLSNPERGPTQNQNWI